MLQIRLTSNEFIYYGAIAGGILGLVLGIVILILGFTKKEKGYAVFGFFSSVILGPISGILSVIVTAIFIWLIFKKPRTVISEQTDSSKTSDKQSSDIEVSKSNNTDSELI